MNELDQARLKKLLRDALPPVDGDSGSERDPWPPMLRRLNSESAAPLTAGWTWNWAWFDGALAAGLVGFAAFFPAAIPLALYYL